MQLKDMLGLYSLPREKDWVQKFWHLAERGEEKKIALKTNFLDPHLQRLATDVIGQFPALTYSLYGGFPQAERARLFMWPDDWAQAPQFNAFSYIQVRGSFKENDLTHRDFLGSLLALGIERDKLGDILYDDNSLCQVVLAKELTPFLLANWNKVGSVKLVPEEIPVDFLKMPEEKYKSIKGTVATPRLDAVAGLGFGLSRSKMAPLIKGEQVKVNWQVVKSPSQHIMPGDVISVSGKGRIIIDSFQGKSRKGRLHLLLKKIL